MLLTTGESFSKAKRMCKCGPAYPASRHIRIEVPGRLAGRGYPIAVLPCSEISYIGDSNVTAVAKDA